MTVGADDAKHETMRRLGQPIRKPWSCPQCGRTTSEQRRWCLLWGPVYWRDKKRIRVPVCASCKKILGKFA